MKLANLWLLCPILFCVSCDPFTWVLGGTAVVGSTAVRNQEGVSGSISDTELQAKINNILFSSDKDIFDRVELAIKHGIVVVIGYMKDEAQCKKTMQIIRNIEGCKDAYDETAVQDMPDISNFALDTSITSRIKSSFSFDGNVHSMNYDVTTVRGVVYICGTAQSKYERDVVLNHARTTSGVEKVFSYVKINKNKDENNS
ncbi:MAG: BON domain-containing protein [Holosporaceae bacterium]|jgi:osmotically-inducible protein OsmY|nr:BON domain-containing protein [Holosporaceae bacterium]